MHRSTGGLGGHGGGPALGAGRWAVGSYRDGMILISFGSWVFSKNFMGVYQL
jgi:hypothetical protein